MSLLPARPPPPRGSIDNVSQRQYGSYQFEIYEDGMFNNKLKLVTTDPNKLEEQAKTFLKLESYNYVAGGAGERATMDSNRLAFRQWKLVPRMLRPAARNLKVELFGEIYDTPVLQAPVGVQAIFHPDKETGLSKVCSELSIPYILSTASSSTIEEVAFSNGAGPRWFQLYWPSDNSITQSLLKRAQESGYKVLVVTLDTFTLAWRPADLDRGYIPFVKGIGNQIGFSDPVFRETFAGKFGSSPEDEPVQASQEWAKDVFSGTSHTWDDIKLLRDGWSGPIVLKGIQHVEDALLAVKYGVNGIIVSNHGGRQLDGAVGSLEVLPEIVDAVGDKITVLFDSGIRTGADIVKALCIGAKGVLIGRPSVYGLAIGGKEGAKQVLQGILADLEQSLALAGITDIQGCNRSMIRKVRYGGDCRSSN